MAMGEERGGGVLPGIDEEPRERWGGEEEEARGRWGGGEERRERYAQPIW